MKICKEKRTGLGFGLAKKNGMTCEWNEMVTVNFRIIEFVFIRNLREIFIR